MKQLFGNLHFLLLRIIRYDKRILRYVWIEVIVSLAVAFVGLRLTQELINLVAQGAQPKQLLTRISLWIVLYALIQIVLKLAAMKSQLLSQMFRIHELARVTQALQSCDYQRLEQEDYQQTKALAFATVQQDSSLTQIFPSNLKRFLEQLLKIALFGAMLSALDRRFLLFIGLLLVLVVIYRWFQHRFIERTKAERGRLNEQFRYIKRVTANFRLAKDVRLFRVRPWFETIAEDVLRNMRQITTRRGRVVLGGQFISALLILLLTFYGYIVLLKELRTGAINVGQLVFYIGTITTIAVGSTDFINVLFDLLDNSTDIMHLKTFLHYPPLFNHTAKQALPESIETIECRGVCFKYPGSEQALFDNLNLTLNRNEKIALVGLNGAGKTTLVKLLLNLYRPDKGQILINGIDNQIFSVDDYYSLFSVVFQDLHLLPMTIRETVLQDQPYQESRYLYVLRASGLSDVIGELPLGDATPLVREVDPDAVTLSGGQLQKLKLAQALYKDAPVLVLDEPTAALDPLAESEVYRRYQAHAKDKLSIFITHRLATTRFCDRILYLDAGKVVEDGTHEQLMQRKGLYQQMYDKQAYYYQKGERR